MRSVDCFALLEVFLSSLLPYHEDIDASTVMLLYVTLGEEGVFLSWAFYRALLMAVSIQLAANCANTYFDFKLTPLYTPPFLLLLSFIVC